MLRKVSTLWRFLLPVLLLLGLAALTLMWQQTSQQLVGIEDGAREHGESLSRLLHTTDMLVSEQVNSAMALLKERGQHLGEPRIHGHTKLGKETLPNLVFGGTTIANNNALVDGVTGIFGGSATIFVKSGHEFVRISTNVRQPNGSRAIGTRLDPNGKAIQAINRGRHFQGMVNILGEPYLTRYDPIFDNSGALIGIWYVGYKVDMQVIREAVQNTRYLNTGFVAIMDAARHIRFWSRNAPSDLDASFFQTPPGNWRVISQEVPEWAFTINVAYPLADAYRAGWSNSLFLIGETTLVAILLITIILWQLRRLVIDPIGSDPALAIEVVQKIAEGDLRSDGLTAKPGTLMAYVLSMREKLQATLQALQKHADDMRLSASVFDHAHDGIFITDANLHIIEVNPSFTKISGYSREDAIGRTPTALGFANNQPDFLEHIREHASSTDDWRGDIHCQRQDGSYYLASLDLFVIESNDHHISHHVGVFSDITADMQHRINLEHLAYHDPLTQLPNRTLLADRLQQALAQTQRSGEILAVCYFDLDDFKEVNDAFGHESGDQLLVQFAARMRACLRESDTIARMGGDEFALLLCNLSSTEECYQALQRLLEAINQPFLLGDISASVSASIGYTIFPSDNSTPDTLLRHADHAMYQAKLNGGRCFHLFDAEHDRLTRGQRQERDRIEQALLANEFRLYYQPKVDMSLGKVVSIEALIRWQHPELGLRQPGEFLPQIEHTDFIIHLGEWVILEALRQMQEWQTKGLDISVSVNIAARHLMQSNFAMRLAELLNFYPDVKPGKLELEITETAVIEDISGVTDIMHHCKLLGVSFALDDFGVGYSSLTYLRRLPIDIIKIDQSFVRDMLHDNDDLALIAGIISLSREFSRGVVAEGVETAEHGVQLLRMGCRIAQGYGITRPLPAAEVLSWVTAYEPDANWKDVGVMLRK